MHVLLPDEDMDRPHEVALEGHIPAEVLKRATEEVANLTRHAGASFERTRTPPVQFVIVQPGVPRRPNGSPTSKDTRRSCSTHPDWRRGNADLDNHADDEIIG